MADKTNIILLGILSLFVMSCADTRKAAYFSGQKDATITTTAGVPETVIRNNDLLSINVSSLNAEATNVFNTPNTTFIPTAGTSASGALIQTTGYLVSADGNILFPIIGAIKASGLTVKQLSELLTRTLVNKKLLTDPIITIRYLNYKVTVLGEVNRPTVVNVPDERISLLEALGLAGDITVYGRKENVMVIRDEEGQKVIKRLNLNSSEIFQSPYYYLKANDIVYVEANNAKVAGSSRSTQILPILLSGLSFAAIIIDRLTR